MFSARQSCFNIVQCALHMSSLVFLGFHVCACHLFIFEHCCESHLTCQCDSHAVVASCWENVFIHNVWKPQQCAGKVKQCVWDGPNVVIYGWEVHTNFYSYLSVAWLFPSSTIKEFLFAADVNSAMISSISAYCRDFDTCMWMICIVTLITI